MGFLMGGLGAIAGAFKDKSKQTYESGLNLADPTEYEKSLSKFEADDFGAMRQLSSYGPGTQEVQDALKSSKSLADMFKEYSASGGMPGAEDFATGNRIADLAFQSQDNALKDAFGDQEIAYGRTAAAMGRSATDPVLQAKMRIEQMRQKGQLNANRGSYATSLAMALPGQRLGYGFNANQILNGLASQAFSNQANLLSLGNSLKAGERNWRLNTANRWSESESESGGGIKGALEGFLGGMGMGMKAQGYANQAGGWGNALGWNQMFQGGGGGLATTPAFGGYGASSAMSGGAAGGGMGVSGLAMIA